MKIFDAIGRGFRKRLNSSVTYEEISSVEDLERVLLGLSGENSAGESVTPNTAMQTSAVAASVRVITSLFGGLPCILFQSEDGLSRRRATEHPLFDVVLHKPNGFQSAFSFQETGKFYDMMRGGTFAWINRLQSGKIVELILLYPDYLTSKQNADYSLEYTYRFPGRPVKVFRQDEVLRIPGLSYNGFDGLSPIAYARQSIGGAIATQKFGNNLFKHGAMPGLMVRYPAIKDEELRKSLKKELFEDYGSGNWHKPMVGWGADFEAKTLGLTSEDIQFLETRRYQRTEIATGIFGVPGNLIGEMGGATYSNIEQQNLAFITATLGSHVKRTEQAYNIQLLTKEERSQGYYFEFALDSLLRGDFKSRMDGLRSGILTGQYSPNEARFLNGQNPYIGGNDHYMPVNMATVEQIAGADDLSNRSAPTITPEEVQ